MKIMILIMVLFFSGCVDVVETKLHNEKVEGVIIDFNDISYDSWSIGGNYQCTITLDNGDKIRVSDNGCRNIKTGDILKSWGSNNQFMDIVEK